MSLIKPTRQERLDIALRKAHHEGAPRVVSSRFVQECVSDMLAEIIELRSRVAELERRTWSEGMIG
jgi:hypothetical protein